MSPNTADELDVVAIVKGHKPREGRKDSWPNSQVFSMESQIASGFTTATRQMATFTTTILASSSRALLNTVRASFKPSQKDTNFLFTVSSNADAADLGSIISYASSLGKNSLGCISAPPRGGAGQAFSFSVAAFSAGISTPFESDIPGRVQAQVGRIRGLTSKRSRDSVGAAKREFERVLDEGGSLGGFESDTGDMIPDGLDLTMFVSESAIHFLSFVDDVFVFFF